MQPDPYLLIADSKRWHLRVGPTFPPLGTAARAEKQWGSSAGKVKVSDSTHSRRGPHLKQCFDAGMIKWVWFGLIYTKQIRGRGGALQFTPVPG